MKTFVSAEILHTCMWMPQIKDIDPALRGCTVFSVLDIKQAYHQIPIAQKSHGDLTISTHRIIYIQETAKWHLL